MTKRKKKRRTENIGQPNQNAQTLYVRILLPRVGLWRATVESTEVMVTHNQNLLSDNAHWGGW